MDSLRPCKLCGMPNVWRINYKGDRNTYCVSCQWCGYCTKEQDTCEEAIDEWNRRHEDGTNS